MKLHEHLSTLTVCLAIPTYNRERILINTLEQVLAQDPPADEILVIDQTVEHESETEEYLAKAHDTGRIRWIKHSPPNLNGARNRALWETICDIIIFIDDDVDLAPSFVAKHVQNYTDLSVVAVAGRTIQANGNMPANKSTPWVKPLGFEPFALNETKRIKGVANFIGANHSVRIDAIRNIGGYDENYHAPLYDESDAALELCKRGGIIVFDPEAEVYHKQAHEGGVRETQSHKQPEYYMSFSSLYFHMKHFFPRWYFWEQALFVQLRRRALRKEVVFRPWRIPWAILSYAYSFLLAAKYCLKGPRYMWDWKRTIQQPTHSSQKS
ncbi:MAG: hypothetical protein B1H11_09435 [Desulfobacteraceae bacterium 4484_190.1]|nr:MAG: hypothetical protein B1H11_09435 [Desulfobacteraceae bacterium 4484_190.1]